MPDTPDPAQTNLELRAPLEPSHGIWVVYKRFLDGLAVLIEQNEIIISHLSPKPPAK
jgi:hypothetical protein